MDKNNYNQMNLLSPELPQKSSIPKIDKGLLLEYRVKRILYHMGYYAHTNVILKTSPDEPSDVITDLDVLGTFFSLDYSFQSTWVDCKSGKADILKHICWINGIKNESKINNIIFVKNGVRKNVKEYAQTLGIKICDLSMLEEMEARYAVNPNDWSGSYDYNLLKNMPSVFSSITVPDIKFYKNIHAFYSSSYWALDAFTQVKKCITGIKQLSSSLNLPLSKEQKLAIKWMLLSFISLFTLSTLKICGQLFYFNDESRKDILISGLMSGSISLKKQNEIKIVAYKMASDIIKQNNPDFDATVFNQALKNDPPHYFDAYYNLISRMIENPNKWNTIVKDLDYISLEYELKDKPLNNDGSVNFQDKRICIKTILYFICDVTGISKETFSILSE